MCLDAIRLTIKKSQRIEKTSAPWLNILLRYPTVEHDGPHRPRWLPFL
jgi:hypothetical protein